MSGIFSLINNELFHPFYEVTTIILEAQLLKEYLNYFLSLKFSGICEANWLLF